MRPAESTSFCLPVKKGWHFEQISTRSSFLVDPVVQVSPHAQWTGTCWYCGWISVFMNLPRVSECSLDGLRTARIFEKLSTRAVRAAASLLSRESPNDAERKGGDCRRRGGGEDPG